MTTLLLAILAVISLANLTGGVLIYVRINRAFENASEAIQTLFETGRAGEPSYFNQTINEITDITAQKVGTSVQAAIRGSIGGTMKGVNAALEAEAIENDPTLAVVSALPKSLRKNQIAMVGLQMLMQKAFAGRSENKNGDNAPSPQAQFNL